MPKNISATTATTTYIFPLSLNAEAISTGRCARALCERRRNDSAGYVILLILLRLTLLQIYNSYFEAQYPQAY